MSHLRETILTVLKDGAEYDSRSLLDRALELTANDGHFSRVANAIGYREFCLQRELEALREEGVLVYREGEPVAERRGRPRIYYRRAP